MEKKMHTTISPTSQSPRLDHTLRANSDIPLAIHNLIKRSLIRTRCPIEVKLNFEEKYAGPPGFASRIVLRKSLK